jgi:hypothetical protein
VDEPIALSPEADRSVATSVVLHDGTDGSRIFRGAVGASLVIDTEGRLWRARSLEDFQTIYTITPTSCDIDTLTPDYRKMREYLAR